MGEHPPATHKKEDSIAADNAAGPSVQPMKKNEHPKWAQDTGRIGAAAAMLALLVFLAAVIIGYFG